MLTTNSFGGNPFNSAHLLGIANAQNDYKDPKATANSSQADIFARQLQSRLLSALSSQIVDAIFGANPQDSGTITFGGQAISFVRDSRRAFAVAREWIGVKPLWIVRANESASCDVAAFA